MVPMAAGQNLADDVDEQTQDGRDVAGNLRHALVAAIGIDTLDGQESDICRKQHGSLMTAVNMKPRTKIMISYGSNGVVPITSYGSNEPSPCMIVDGSINEDDFKLPQVDEGHKE